MPLLNILQEIKDTVTTPIVDAVNPHLRKLKRFLGKKLKPVGDFLTNPGIPQPVKDLTNKTVKNLTDKAVKYATTPREKSKPPLTMEKATGFGKNILNHYNKLNHKDNIYEQLHTKNIPSHLHEDILNLISKQSPHNKKVLQNHKLHYFNTVHKQVGKELGHLGQGRYRTISKNEYNDYLNQHGHISDPTLRKEFFKYLYNNSAPKQDIINKGFNISKSLGKHNTLDNINKLQTIYQHIKPYYSDKLYSLVKDPKQRAILAVKFAAQKHGIKLTNAQINAFGNTFHEHLKYRNLPYAQLR